MKIMWVVNVLIGDVCNELNKPHPTSGGWMESLLDDFKNSDQDEIVVITTEKRNKEYFFEKGKIKYYILNCSNLEEFKFDKPSNIECVRRVIEIEKPDIVNIWGTEYSLGLTVLNCLVDIPSIVYIQGILDTISRYYEAGMSGKELRKSITLRDVIKLDWIKMQKRKFAIKAKIERKIIKKSGNVIVENMWCKVHCKAIDENVVIHYCKLNIRNQFMNVRWDYKNIQKYSIMCNASGYPLKGLHILLKALKIVAVKYPNVKLYIPGYSIGRKTGLLNQLRQTGYSKFIQSIINEYNLEENLEFIGILDANKMAESMSKANVFVVPSALENHSSTLKEALIVGAPCISSYVGGVPEYINNGENGFLYRFEEYEVLAEYICMIFDDEKLAVKLSSNAIKAMTEYFEPGNIHKNIREIYKQVMLQHNNSNERH